MVLFNSPLPFDKERMAHLAHTRPAREASDYFVRQGTDADALAAELATPTRGGGTSRCSTFRFWAHPGGFLDVGVAPGPVGSAPVVDFHTEPFADAASSGRASRATAACSIRCGAAASHCSTRMR